MKRILATILSICALTAFATPKTALFATHADSAPIKEITTQSRAVFSSDTTGPQLLSPSSYEEYLSLSAPTDVAVCDNYTAIADGNILYVYDRADGIYRQYVHGNSVQGNITKIQFDKNERLYFLDAATSLYFIEPSQLGANTITPKKTELVCSTFAIYDNQLFYANTSGNKSQISGAPLNNLTFSASTTYVENLTLTPMLAFYKNELYYTNSGQYLYKIATSGNNKASLICAFDKELLSLSITNGKVYYVNVDGEFFVYDLNALADAKQANEVSPLDTQTGGYSAISLHSSYAYLIKNKGITQYSLAGSKFTNYEITSISNAIDRLNQATDVTLANDKLFLADVGNKRISVYDIRRNEFLQPITTNISAQYIASTGSTVLLAGKTTATLFDVSQANYGNELSVSPRIDGNIVGAVNVYGKYYMATDKNRFYTLSQNEQTGVWEWTSAQKNFTQFPTALTADPYGNLYVACDANVFAYTEANFTTMNISTDAVLTNLPNDTEKLRADYRGNLYALANNTLYKFNAPQGAGEKFTAGSMYTFNDGLVFGNNKAVQSFALSLDSNAVYLLHKDNFLTVTDKIQIPTIHNIPVNNADKSIFNNEPTFTVVQTKPDAVLVEFDANNLKGATVFPTLSYLRSEKALNALKIGETDVYNIIVAYSEQKSKYTTYLVYSSACQEYKATDYKTTYTKEEQRDCFVINNTALYKIPYASDLFATQDIPRNGRVTLLGEIKKLDHLYYYVSYVNEKGETKTGYVPQLYISSSQGDIDKEMITIGGTKNNVAAYGRLAYILTGTAVICVLVDYLILRKPKEDDEDNEEENN